MEYIKLGASLYLPATRWDLEDIIIRNKYPFLKSVILDTEDSVAFEDLQECYTNLRKLLSEMPSKKIGKQIMVFIRPRGPKELKEILSFDQIENIDGFVLPKFSSDNMREYLSIMPLNMWYMPVLEKNIFSEHEIFVIRDFILENRQNLLSVRIGITDILNILKARRIKNQSVYEISVASHIISRIVFAFAPYDVNITGTVYENFGSDSTSALRQEVEKDLGNGIFGKSAIHPSQVQVINDVYKVSLEEYETASKLLDVDSPSVFKLHNSMQERATHLEWAKKIMARKEVYGFN
jgi:citrate lyase beta subunit